jgi:phage host-nuclease inhibitor protein Gam
MSDNTRELDKVQVEIDRLHERSQANKTNISAHEAVCEIRHEMIMENITALSEEIKAMHKKLNNVSELATKGKTSIHTLLWVGGVVAGIIAIVTAIISVIPK